MRDYEVPSGGDWSVHRGGTVFLQGLVYRSLPLSLFKYSFKQCVNTYLHIHVEIFQYDYIYIHVSVFVDIDMYKRMCIILLHTDPFLELSISIS